MFADVLELGMHGRNSIFCLVGAFIGNCLDVECSHPREGITTMVSVEFAEKRVYIFAACVDLRLLSE